MNEWQKAVGKHDWIMECWSAFFDAEICIYLFKKLLIVWTWALCGKCPLVNSTRREKNWMHRLIRWYNYRHATYFIRNHKNNQIRLCKLKVDWMELSLLTTFCIVFICCKQSCYCLIFKPIPNNSIRYKVLEQDGILNTELKGGQWGQKFNFCWTTISQFFIA